MRPDRGYIHLIEVAAFIVSMLAFGASAFGVYFAHRADDRAQGAEQRAKSAESRAEAADRRDQTRLLMERKAVQSALHAELLAQGDDSRGCRRYTIRVTNTGGGLASDGRAYLVNRHGAFVVDHGLKRVLPGGGQFEEVEFLVGEQARVESPLRLRLQWRDATTGEEMETTSGVRFPDP